MGKPDEVKNQSLWTTTLEDIDETSLPTEKDIQKARKYIERNNIDINKPTPEVEKLAKIFETKPER